MDVRPLLCEQRILTYFFLFLLYLICIPYQYFSDLFFLLFLYKINRIE